MCKDLNERNFCLVLVIDTDTILGNNVSINDKGVLMSSMLEMILKQSPWLHDSEIINSDIHLSRLNKFKYIHHEKDFLQYPFEDGVY
ncbi:MAG: hypothetical protein M3R00_04345, partial [Pseudomonadota bacterium]|nr:hypothetical protein [Pseudomonadota bacterium]